MPGLVGLIGNPLSKDRKVTVEKMLASIHHEKFYSRNTYECDAVSAGWFVDSVFNPRDTWAKDPVNDCVLILSGEPFVNPASGSFLPENTTADYFLRIYQSEGLCFLERLNGWFSGVLVDNRRKEVVLFNDRFGMNRLYWAETSDGFYFASEAKAILSVCPHLRRLDERGLGELLACGCVLQNRTLYTGISLIPGGSSWIFHSHNTVRRTSYFNPATLEGCASLAAAEYFEELRSLWSRILPRYLRENESCALSLTGGVDSRMILACASRPEGSLPCFTFDGMFRECADAAVSRTIAGICGQPHHMIRLGEPFLQDFPALVERMVYITDGTLDPTGAADLYVNRLARQIAPVRVTGLNGGELLRQLVMFKPWTPPPGLFVPEVERSIGSAKDTYAQERTGHPLSFIAFKQSPWHLQARLAVERSQLTIRTPYFDNELLALAYRAPREMLGIEPALRIIAEGYPALSGIGTDRASLLRAIPGITHIKNAVQNFSFRAEYAYDYGMPQWLARVDHVFAPFHLERLFLGRHKFYHYRVWYRDQLSEYIKGRLLDGAALDRSYLNRRATERVISDHTRGVANHTLEIHRLLMLELIHQKLLS